jgi:hypothetical protein
MTDHTNRPPLWEVMHDADIAVSRETGPIASRRGYAAEIRAIVEWVEERTAATTAFEPEEMPVVWRIAGMLLAEADRAEAGG